MGIELTLLITDLLNIDQIKICYDRSSKTIISTHVKKNLKLIYYKII